MPTYRSITLSLISQFDILTIPEFAPPTTPNDPFSNAPTLINPDHSLVSVYIPTYPASQFWLSYSISPPHPPKLLYYFKLYINNNLIVSWGCGEDDGYKGKTMFGLFDSIQGRGFVRQSLIERRVLCFTPEAIGRGKLVTDHLNDLMEIKVFRSKGRKRIMPDIQEYQSSPGVQHVDKKGPQQQVGAGINLINAGFLSVRHPKRFYKYALLDPLDQPFATFRYYYRSWDQLETLGVISPTPSVESSSVRSLTPTPRQISPKSSSNTLKSFSSVLTSFGNGHTTAANENGKTLTSSDSTYAFTADSTTERAIDSITKSTTEINSSPSSTDVSPLKIPPLDPLRMHRPPTPPPMSTPSKTLTQLPPTIPSTLTIADLAGHTLTPKESFTSLIRTHLPSPDTTAFQLKNPSDEDIPQPPSPLRTRSTSMGALMSVVSNAKNRRSNNRRASEESGVSGSSGGSEGSLKKSDDGGCGSKDTLVEIEREKRKKRNAKEEKKKKKKKKKEKKRCKDSGGGSGGGQAYCGELPLGERCDRKGRKLHLWEEI